MNQKKKLSLNFLLFVVTYLLKLLEVLALDGVVEDAVLLDVPRELDALLQPRQARDEQEREVAELLDRDHKTSRWVLLRVDEVGGQKGARVRG